MQAEQYPVTLIATKATADGTLIGAELRFGLNASFSPFALRAGETLTVEHVGDVERSAFMREYVAAMPSILDTRYVP